MFARHHVSRRALVTLLTAISLTSSSRAAEAAVDSETATLINRGEFAKAEERLKQQINDEKAPVTSDAAIQLEILRRTRQDFNKTNREVLSELKKAIPGVTQADVDRWQKSGDLHARMIDGELRYFDRAVPNLFRINAESRKRRAVTPPAEKKYAITDLVAKLVSMAEAADGPNVYPVKHKVRYELTVHDDHPRVKPGATVRAWLSFPQEYRQQSDVRLIRTEPQHVSITDNGKPHRAIYFEQKLGDSPEPPQFVAEFEFVTSAYCPLPEAAEVKPYDTDSDVYREFTAERPPHIVFTPEVKKLAAEIVGDEKNPLEKARRVFRWVSKNIPWCSEMEYSTIPSLSAKGISARRGDCGVQGLVFVTLCRAAGVPARWQSGWQTKPGDWNMHDWSEFYVEPWGWLPADASYGVREHSDPRVRDFFCGNMDPYRLIVNLDYGQPLTPAKTSFRSEPNDFQRGEIEIDGHNLYFDEWDWKFRVESKPVGESTEAAGR